VGEDQRLERPIEVNGEASGEGGIVGSSVVHASLNTVASSTVAASGRRSNRLSKAGATTWRLF
jgi:hypothetical protein